MFCGLEKIKRKFINSEYCRERVLSTSFDYFYSRLFSKFLGPHGTEFYQCFPRSGSLPYIGLKERIAIGQKNGVMEGVL